MPSPEPRPGLRARGAPPPKRSRSATSAPPSSTSSPLGIIPEEGMAGAQGRAPSRARRLERGADSRAASS
eukprot:7895185-Alexandrium_andersonii.AAC.1